MATLLPILCLALAAPVPVEAVQLPSTPSPLQVLASIDKDGQVSIVSSVTEYRKAVKVTAENGVKRETLILVPVTSYRTQVFALKDVQIYDTASKEIDRNKLAELLKKPIPVLVSADGGKVDPLHLRIIKDGTLVFVVPSWQARPAPPAQLPPDK
jgi:hypothetical protein